MVAKVRALGMIFSMHWWVLRR